jgi:oligoendopeptidase F
MVRLRDHTLSAKEEELLALGGNALSASQKAFSALNDADLDFGTVIDSEGNEHTLTHGSYQLLLRSPDRVLRKNAFEALHQRFSNHGNTIAELLNGQVQAHLFQARAHRYPSCLDAALYPKNVDTTVYHSLIEAVQNKLPLLHKYTRLRKRVLGVKELHMYDLYCPLVPDADVKMDYTEAEQLVIDSVAPLGEEYQSLLRKGLQQEHWVDRFENKNKRSGAYSSGCYDSMPYILMNYKGLLRDTFTLAHEAGHSMHSLLSRTHQAYQYSDYPIFLAEVASTFNEELLAHHLLNKTEDPKVRAYLLNERIEDLRGTLLRQTMFAQFELAIHQKAEEGEPLTPKTLSAIYQQLSSDFFGPDVVIDDEITIEWARIPHFYYNFYVYQYATGISTALALSKLVLEGGEKEREQYLSFLKGGCSKFPLDQLRCAGVDLSTPEPVETALELFGRLVDELEETLDVLASKAT